MSHTIYPIRCIPRKKYREIGPEYIDALRNRFVIRYSERDVPLPDSEALSANLKESMSSQKFVTGLSVTLVGVYKKEDAKYVVNRNRMDYLSSSWQPGMPVRRVRQSDFRYVPKRGYYGLLINRILSCSFDMAVFKNNVKIRTDIVKYEIQHLPTHCNYWHFCIFPYAIHSETKEKYYLRDNKPSANAASNATKNIASILKECAVLSSEVIEKPINARIYRIENE